MPVLCSLQIQQSLLAHYHRTICGRDLGNSILMMQICLETGQGVPIGWGSYSVSCFELLFKTDRQKVTKIKNNVNAMDLLKNSHNLWNINYKKHLSFAAVCLQKNSKLENNRSGETQCQTNLNVEPRP